jgi:hypothetical protein
LSRPGGTYFSLVPRRKPCQLIPAGIIIDGPPVTQAHELAASGCGIRQSEAKASNYLVLERRPRRGDRCGKGSRGLDRRANGAAEGVGVDGSRTHLLVMQNARRQVEPGCTG